MGPMMAVMPLVSMLTVRPLRWLVRMIVMMMMTLFPRWAGRRPALTAAPTSAYTSCVRIPLKSTSIRHSCVRTILSSRRRITPVSSRAPSIICCSFIVVWKSTTAGGSPQGLRPTTLVRERLVSKPRPVLHTRITSLTIGSIPSTPVWPFLPCFNGVRVHAKVFNSLRIRKVSFTVLIWSKIEITAIVRATDRGAVAGIVMAAVLFFVVAPATPPLRTLKNSVGFGFR